MSSMSQTTTFINLISKNCTDESLQFSLHDSMGDRAPTSTTFTLSMKPLHAKLVFFLKALFLITSGQQ